LSSILRRQFTAKSSQSGHTMLCRMWISVKPDSWQKTRRFQYLHHVRRRKSIRTKSPVSRIP